MDSKKKEVVELSPKSSEYASRIAAAKGVAHPVGGAPMPKMPNFAEAQTQDRHAGVQNQRAGRMSALLTPEQREQLEKSGKMIPGVGSGFAVNQPGLQQSPEYQNPPRPAGGLREETAKQLEAVAQANAPKPSKDGEDFVPTADKLAQEIEEGESEFDFDEFGRRIHSLLQNKERRLLIESRCEPMDLMELLTNKEVRQVVPIVPKKYEPEFRSMGGDEDLYVKRLLSKESGVSQTYVLSRMTLLNITCGLFAINGKPLPTHLNSDGDVGDEQFQAKYKSIIKYPMPLLADLAVNYDWFDKRVRKLLVVDELKGF